MRQAWHIFRKDVRTLWVQIATVLALHLAYVLLWLWLSEPQAVTSGGSLSGAANTLLGLGWFFVITVAIQADPLPGLRQFWVTHPYSRASLLAAKLLFCAVTVNVPLLLSDLVLLKASSVPVVESLPGLGIRQLQNTLLYVAPALVIGTISTSLAMAWGLLLAAYAAMLFGALLPVWMLFSHGPATEGVVLTEANPAVVLPLVLAFLVWQYGTRHSQAGRVVLFGAVAVWPFWLISPVTQRTIPYRPAEPAASAYVLLWDSARGPRASTQPPAEGLARFDLPVRVSGLPGKGQLSLLASHIRLAGILPGDVGGMARWERDQAGDWLVLDLAQDRVLALNGRVQIDARLDLQWRSPDVLAGITSAEPVLVPGVGTCRLVEKQRVNAVVDCWGGPREPLPVATRLRTPTAVGPLGTLPGPADPHPGILWGMAPVKRLVLPLQAPDGTALDRVLQESFRIEMVNPLATVQFKRSLRFNEVELNRYRRPR